MNKDKTKLLKQLVSSDIISDELLADEGTKLLSSEQLFKVLTSAYELDYDDGENVLYYIDENGEKFIAPDLSEGLSTSSEWLCDALPIPNIDIDQGGSVRRSIEVRSLYTLVCLSIVFKDMKDEIEEFINSYNFIDYSIDSTTSNGFTSAADYLKSFTDLNSLQINCVVSAASINLTQAQEKKDALWRSNLTREETLELSKITRDVKSIILKFEKEEKLNPNDVGDLTKLQKLTAIQKRDIEIEKIINSSKFSTLYRIIKLNSERLSPISKRKILLASRKIAELQVQSVEETAKLRIQEIYDETYYEMQRKLTKKAVSTMIDREIKKYKSDPENYKFIKKI